ncbi:MAG: NAD(P)/FAD-dependent oxidoreductase [Lachnospiraceae bacterium]|nr:NAD(P)/FAD-dependent oxidoreductase [Lachnospiraceae bacterium]
MDGLLHPSSMYDIIIIGAGVSGAAIARELSRYQYRILMLEKEEDVCAGTSKANSGIVHAGFDTKPGSLMSRLNLRGSRMMEELARELDIPYRRNGSLVLCFSEADRPQLQSLYEQGLANGVEDLRLLSAAEVKALEPTVSDQAVAALYAPTGAIICPFELTLAMAESAVINGVSLMREAEVIAIQRDEERYLVQTTQGMFQSRLVINAAGVYADHIHRMISRQPLSITARRGEYCLMDQRNQVPVSHTIFQLPTALGKGVLVTPTVHGNVLVGPTAIDIEDKTGTETTAAGIGAVLQKAALSVPAVNPREVITTFSGLRAHRKEHDFLIAEAADAPGFIDVAGIESPGLSSAPAIGEYVAGLVRHILPVDTRADWQAGRTRPFQFAAATAAERQAKISEDARFAQMICRCELVTEGEIVAAIHGVIGARSVDGIKRRTRAGMGRCQSGFCLPHTLRILARELQLSPEKITKKGGSSLYLTGSDKEGL